MSLFELLVVLSVITIAVATGFVSMGRLQNNQSLERSADMIHSMVRVARTQAITNGAHTRLIINLDTNDSESYLRRVGVMLEDTATTDSWIALERGVLLPDGVFVVPQNAETVSFSADWPPSGRRSVYRSDNNDTSDEGAVYDLEYAMNDPVTEGGANAVPWMAIRFAPNGRLATADWGSGGLEPASNQLVLATGGWQDGKVHFSEPNRFIAINFKRNGTSFESADPDLVDDKE